MALHPCPDCGAPRRPSQPCRADGCTWAPSDRRKPSRQQRGYDADHDRIRRQLIRRARRHGDTLCPLCGRYLDIDLPGTHRYGPHAHHLAGKPAGNHLGNYALAHNICNTQAGDPTT